MSKKPEDPRDPKRRQPPAPEPKKTVSPQRAGVVLPGNPVPPQEAAKIPQQRRKRTEPIIGEPSRPADPGKRKLRATDVVYANDRIENTGDLISNFKVYGDIFKIDIHFAEFTGKNPMELRKIIDYFCTIRELSHLRIYAAMSGSRGTFKTERSIKNSLNPDRVREELAHADRILAKLKEASGTQVPWNRMDLAYAMPEFMLVGVVKSKELEENVFANWMCKFANVPLETYLNSCRAWATKRQISQDIMPGFLAMKKQQYDTAQDWFDVWDAMTQDFVTYKIRTIYPIAPASVSGDDTAKKTTITLEPPRRSLLDPSWDANEYMSLTHERYAWVLRNRATVDEYYQVFGAVKPSFKDSEMPDLNPERRQFDEPERQYGTTIGSGILERHSAMEARGINPMSDKTASRNPLDYNQQRNMPKRRPEHGLVEFEDLEEPRKVRYSTAEAGAARARAEGEEELGYGEVSETSISIHTVSEEETSQRSPRPPSPPGGGAKSPAGDQPKRESGKKSEEEVKPDEPPK